MLLHKQQLPLPHSSVTSCPLVLDPLRVPTERWRTSIEVIHRFVLPDDLDVLYLADVTQTSQILLLLGITGGRALVGGGEEESCGARDRVDERGEVSEGVGDVFGSPKSAATGSGRPNAKEHGRERVQCQSVEFPESRAVEVEEEGRRGSKKIRHEGDGGAIASLNAVELLE